MPMFLAPQGYTEYECKYALDGYSFQNFIKELQAHFQFGYAVTRIGGQVALHPNSRLSFRTLACASDDEKKCIPLVCGLMAAQLGALKVLDWKLRRGALLFHLPALQGQSQRGVVCAMFTADFKAHAVMLNRGGAQSNHYCFFNLTQCVGGKDGVNHCACSTPRSRPCAT